MGSPVQHEKLKLVCFPAERNYDREIILTLQIVVTIRTKLQWVLLYDTHALYTQISELVILFPSLSCMATAPWQTQLFLKLFYVRARPTMASSLFRFPSPQRKDQICVWYTEKEKIRGVCSWKTARYIQYQLQLKWDVLFQKLPHTFPIISFKLNKNIKNNTGFLLKK